MFKSYRYDIGLAFRRQFKIRLDELGLPYTEHKGFVDSVIIVKTHTPAQEDAYAVFAADFRAFMRRMSAIDAQIAAEELARKNRFRRLTFRKPLTSLR